MASFCVIGTLHGCLAASRTVQVRSRGPVHTPPFACLSYPLVGAAAQLPKAFYNVQKWTWNTLFPCPCVLVRCPGCGCAAACSTVHESSVVPHLDKLVNAVPSDDHPSGSPKHIRPCCEVTVCHVPVPEQPVSLEQEPDGDVPIRLLQRRDMITKHPFALMEMVPPSGASGARLAGIIPATKGAATEEQRVQTTHCCHRCGKVAPNMAACKQCRHAHFCSKPCLEAAWPTHKPLSAELAREHRRQPTVDGKLRFLHDLFLPDALSVRPTRGPSPFRLQLLHVAVYTHGHPVWRAVRWVYGCVRQVATEASEVVCSRRGRQ